MLPKQAFHPADTGPYMRCMEDGYDGSAGLLLALGGLTRLFPFVIGGYLLIRRRWRVTFFAAAGLCC